MEMAENKIEEAGIEEEGFWDYVRMTITSLVAVAFLCILGAHLFFGIDVLYQDGHFSYELGNHPCRTEIRSIHRRENFFPQVIQVEPVVPSTLGIIIPKDSNLTWEWFPERSAWPAIWPEKSKDRREGK